MSRDAGDTFEQFFRDTFSQVAAFAFRLVDDYDVAEDMALGAFVSAWRNESGSHRPLSTDEERRRYVFRATRNAALNHLRGTSTQQRILASGMTTQDIIIPGASQALAASDRISESDEIDQHVRRAIARMPEQRRTTYALKWELGLSNREVAEILEVSIKTVEMHVTLALKELRRELAWLRDGHGSS